MKFNWRVSKNNLALKVSRKQWEVFSLDARRLIVSHCQSVARRPIRHWTTEIRERNE